MVIVCFAPFLFSDKVSFLFHQILFTYPDWIFYARHLSHGALPLWDPFRGCGEPFLADIQRSALYPPSLLLLLVPIRLASALFVAGHVLLGGLGTYALARTWRLSSAACLLASVSFAFNSFSLTRVECNAPLASYCWYPVVLFAFTHWLRRRTRGSFVLLVAVLCLQFLGGFPETTLFTGCTLGLYALFVGVYEWRSRRTPRSLLSPLLTVGTAGAVAVLLSMIQFLPTCEALLLSERAAPTNFDMIENSSLHPLSLFSLLLPSVYGVPPDVGDYWAPSIKSYWLGTFYTGVAPLVVLAMVGLFKLFGGRGARAQPAPENALRARVPLLATLFVFFFLYAAGKYTPLYPFLWRVLPPIQRFTMPPKSLMCVVLSLSLAAGMGLDWLVDRAARVESGLRRWRQWTLRWGTVVAFAVLSILLGADWANGGHVRRRVLELYFNLGPHQEIPWALLRDSAKLMVIGPLFGVLLYGCTFGRRWRRVCAWSIVLGAFADLYISNAFLLSAGPSAALERKPSFLKELQPRGRIVRYYESVDFSHPVPAFSPEQLEGRAETYDPSRAVPDDTVTFGGSVMWALRDMIGYHWASADEAFNLSSISNFQSRETAQVLKLLQDLGVPSPYRQRLLAMLNCERIVDFPDVREAISERRAIRLKIIGLQGTLPRAYVVGGLKVLEDDAAEIEALSRQWFDPESVALIDRASASDGDLVGLPPGRVKHRVDRLTYGLNSLEIEVTCERDGLLVVSDTHYPGWVATVNGRRSPIHEVNYAFRGIRVPAGTSVVRMVYEPVSLRIGIAVSILTMILLIVYVTARRRRKIGGQEESGRVPV